MNNMKQQLQLIALQLVIATMSFSCCSGMQKPNNKCDKTLFEKILDVICQNETPKQIDNQIHKGENLDTGTMRCLNDAPAENQNHLDAVNKELSQSSSDNK